jgi:hypothetical protein
VAPFETPQTTPVAPVPPAQQFQVSDPFLDIEDGKWKVRVRAGWVLTIDPASTGGPVMGYLEASEADFEVTAGTKIYCKVVTAKDDLATAADLIAEAVAPEDIHAQPDPSGIEGEYHYRIADFTTVAGKVVVATRYHQNGPIIHRPARNDRNLKIMVYQVTENTDGFCEISGSPKYAFFRQGVYVGNTDPGDGAEQDILETTFVASAS